MIKLFGWEGKVSQRIQDKRVDELSYLWKLKVLEVLNGVIKYATENLPEVLLMLTMIFGDSHIIPTIVMLITYATFAVIMKQELTRTHLAFYISIPF